MYITNMKRSQNFCQWKKNRFVEKYSVIRFKYYQTKTILHLINVLFFYNSIYQNCQSMTTTSFTKGWGVIKKRFY